METWAAIAILGGVVAMDTTSGPQMMISEPLVSSALIGFLFGDPIAGIAIGVVFQLLWLDYMPLGAVRFTDHNMASLIATASLLSAEKWYGMGGGMVRAGVIPAFLFGILVGWLGLQVTSALWRWNDRRSVALLAKAREGTFSGVVRVHSMGLGAAFLKGVAMTVLFVPVGMELCGLVRHVPAEVRNAFALGSIMIFGTVAASAVHFFWVNERARRPLALGAIGGIVWLIAALR